MHTNSDHGQVPIEKKPGDETGHEEKRDNENTAVVNQTTAAPGEIRPRPQFKPSDDGQFAWISTSVHARIMRLGPSEGTFAVAVYIALAVLSAKNRDPLGKPLFGCPVVSEPVNVIAGLAGLSYNTTKRILRELARIGVIAIEEGKRIPGNIKQPPHVYTLLLSGIMGKKKRNQTAPHTGSRCHPVVSPDVRTATTCPAETLIDTLPSGESISNDVGSPGSVPNCALGGAAALAGDGNSLDTATDPYADLKGKW